jgi:hypothetical protein
VSLYVGDDVARERLAEAGETVGRYLRTVDPVVDVIGQSDADWNLERDYASAMQDIGYWLVAWWCKEAGHPEWCDEILDEDGWPLYDDEIEPMAVWFATKLATLTA